MEQVFNNYEGIANTSNSEIKKLTKLREDLEAKRQQRLQTLTQTGKIDLIQIDSDPEVSVINEAIATIDQARKQVDPNFVEKPSAENKAPEVLIENIDNQTVAHLKLIREVPGQALRKGEQFKSMDGYTNYMKTNIQGLFDLTRIKETLV